MAKKGLNQAAVGDFYNSEEYYIAIPGVEKSPIRYFFTGDNSSCSLSILPGGLPHFPEHHHPHEQFMVVLQGDGYVSINGEKYEGEEGFFAYCPPNLPHDYVTTDASYTCWNLDIFYPERLEYEKETYFELLAQGKKPMQVMITKEDIKKKGV